MTKAKKKVTGLLTKEEAIEKMHEFAYNSSQLKKLEALVEIEKQKAAERYQEQINNYRAVAEEASNALHHYAEFNKKELFKERKTVDLVHGTLTLRLGTHKVEKSRKLTWEAAVEKIKSISGLFIRTTEEVNKEAIISNRDDKDLMAALYEVGIQVVQDQTITVASKEEELVER